MTAQTAAAGKLTLVDSVKELGFFSWLFAVVVAGPSILSLTQAVFVNHSLIDALQWIVDGYNGIMDVVGHAIEPIFAPLILWINSVFNWSLELQPHWRPLLVLCMIVVMSVVRTNWTDGDHGLAIKMGIVHTIGAMFGVLLAGVIPLSGGWWVQGVLAGAPPTFFFLAIALMYLIQGEPDSEFFTAATIAAVGMFVIGAGLSFVPGLSHGSGLVTLALGIMAMGFIAVLTALASGSQSNVRLGLTILGGFVTAGFILAADAAAKAWGPAELATVSAPVP